MEALLPTLMINWMPYQDIGLQGKKNTP